MLAVVVIALVGCPDAANARGDADAGKTKSVVCIGCHGGDGNGSNPQYPKLAGQHELYLVKALRAYQTGARKDPLMTPLVSELSEADIEDLAAYYASQVQK